MKTLQIGNTDLVGNRFNGHDLHKDLIRRGIDSEHCVFTKLSEDENTWQLCKSSIIQKGIRSICSRIENHLSLQSLIYPFSLKLIYNKKFLDTDIVHYHLIHGDFFSIASLPILSKMKPTVWTVHDPWAITGHCIYPFNCNKWETGCGNCPDLKVSMTIRRDTTALLYNIKKEVYQKSNLEIIVASKFMYNMIKKSPLMSKFRVHHIPFGVNLNIFKSISTEKAKSELGISSDSLVIMFRATNNIFKGLKYIKNCLYSLKTNKKICLLTFNDKGLLEEFKNKFQIIELGWVDDVQKTVRAYNAADIVLMPSTQEAFGVMAIEAMACGKPIIVFDGTSLPEVVFAPHGGLSVPQGDTTALSNALKYLINNLEVRNNIGQKARDLAVTHYDFNQHVDKIVQLYKEVIERRRKVDN